MQLVGIDLGTVRHQSVWVAETFWERLRGLNGRPPDAAMLLPGWSVHGVGMRRRITVIALDAEFRVMATRQLRPGGVCAVRGARWMLELPTWAEPPSIGTATRFFPTH